MDRYSVIALLMFLIFFVGLGTTLSINKTFDLNNVIFILILVVFFAFIFTLSVYLRKRNDKIDIRIYEEKKRQTIGNIRKILANNNVEEEAIKERIAFLEQQKLKKVEEIEIKLKEITEKNRKDEINEYNFFNPIENKK